MPDRKTPPLSSWLAPALALLAWVLVASTPVTGFDATSSPPHLAPAHFALPPSPPTTSLDAAIPVDTAPQVNALPSESEEQDPVDALDQARFPVQVPCSFRKAAVRRLIAPRPVPSLYPLRC